MREQADAESARDDVDASCRGPHRSRDSRSKNVNSATDGRLSSLISSARNASGQRAPDVFRRSSSAAHWLSNRMHPVEEDGSDEFRDVRPRKGVGHRRHRHRCSGAKSALGLRMGARRAKMRI